MRARVVMVISVWVSTAAGAARLLGDTGAAAGAGAGVLGLSYLLASHFRRRRFRVWDTSGESGFPPGPRRVLLVDAGLAPPDSR